MNKNDSPWIKQLKTNRPTKKLESHAKTDVVVVGGGIAGVTTAYFILKNTNFKVTMLEATKVAHGATGHNAGQVVSYFERQISKIAEEFGDKLATEAQEDILSAWLLTEEIFKDAKLESPFYQFTGYAGMSDFDEIMIHAKNSFMFRSASLLSESLLVAEESDVAKRIPKEYRDLCTFMPHKDILALLETTDTRYVAALTARKGCLNSALFTEELAGHLLACFADRFTLYEESPMDEVVLHMHGADLKVGHRVLKADKVVLCTNGFEKFTITNHGGPEIDTHFHHMVKGTVGYMAGYLEDRDKSPIALSFIGDKDVYFYMTRRPFEDEKNEKHNLICIGGPEASLEDTSTYAKDDYLYPDEALSDIDAFVHQTYQDSPKEKIDYKYQWHGLMGYTPNGVRLIGPEPRNKNLFYNLGCNGVGILPSIFGAKKIADLLAGKEFAKSIFDPR